MATSGNEQFYEVIDFSGGVQRKTTKFMRGANQLEFSVNASYNRIGGIEKVEGYTRIGNTITSTTSSTSSTTTSSSSTSTSTSSSSSTSTSTSTSSTTTP